MQTVFFPQGRKGSKTKTVPNARKTVLTFLRNILKCLLLKGKRKAVITAPFNAAKIFELYTLEYFLCFSMGILSRLRRCVIFSFLLLTKRTKIVPCKDSCFCNLKPMAIQLAYHKQTLIPALTLIPIQL